MAVLKYPLDHNIIIIIIIVVMQYNVDLNQINSNFQVFVRPQCYYHYCSYAIKCGPKSYQ